MIKIKDLFLKILNKPLYFWSLVVLVYIVARVATWGYPFDSDHWIFYYVGKIWAQGGTMYVAAWDHKPPLIFVFNGLMYLMFGGNLVLHRIWLTLLSIVDIALFWQLIKRVMPALFSSSPTSQISYNSVDRGSPLADGARDSRLRGNDNGVCRDDNGGLVDIAAKVGLLLYVFWRNLSQFTSSGNNTENYGLIFLLGMLLSYLSFRKDQKWWKMLISGACFSVLFFLKGNFLLLAVPIGILLLIDNWKSIHKFFGYGLIFVAPLVIQAGFWVYYFAGKNALSDFFIASFIFSAKYSASAWKGGLSELALFYILIAMASPLIIFGPLLFISELRRNRTKEFLFWSLMLVFASIAFFAVGVPYLYYFEIVMPVYCIAVTYLMFKRDTWPRMVNIILLIIFGFTMALNLGFSMLQVKNSFVGNARKEADEYQQIAAYVDTKTLPTDKVFAYDYGATFYRLAQRDSGSRFVSASVLLLENRDNYGLGFDKIFISDMEKNQTKYVVVYRDRDNIYYQNKPITEYFDTHYVLDKAFTKFEVLKRK